MPTQFLFRDDAYLDNAKATVVAAHLETGIELDQTIFYAQSGGQPGDAGSLTVPDGTCIKIANTVHPNGDKSVIAHLPAETDWHLTTGDEVMLHIDWPRRHHLMRMHTALHLLSVAFPFPVTGGSISEAKGRLDFDMPEIPDDLPAIEDQLNQWINADLPVTSEWISEDELDASPELVKTMKVQPPRGQGRVRLIRISDVDLQPCGGTHVKSTAEIGPVKLGKIEKKGKQNRRVSLLFAEV